MIPTTQASAVELSSLSAGDIFIAGSRLVLAIEEGFDQEHFEIETGEPWQPDVTNVLKINETWASFDPGSGIDVGAEVPTGSLIFTRAGPAIYRAPEPGSRLGLYLFLTGKIGQYRRSHEPAFSRWELYVKDGDQRHALRQIEATRASHL